MEKKIENIEKLTVELADIYANYSMGFINRMEAVYQSAEAIQLAVTKLNRLNEDDSKRVKEMVIGLYRLRGTEWLEIAKSLIFGMDDLEKAVWVANKCLEYKHLCEYFNDWAKTKGPISSGATSNDLKNLAFGWLSTNDSNVGTYFGDYSKVDYILLNEI